MSSKFSLSDNVSSARTGRLADVHRFDDAAAPRLALLAREVAVLANITSGRFAVTRLAERFGPGCDSRPVLLVPGFLAAPGSMAVLEAALTRTGYRARDWGMGRNMGLGPDTLERLTDAVARQAERHGEAVTMIGWSLGGLFAREVAKRRPDLVREVATLGTPFSGDARANRAWRLYERVAGHPVDAPPIPIERSAKPPVPTTAFWSRRDGVVAPASARGVSGERDRAIELDCGHLGFASQPRAMEAILAHLEAGRA